MNLKKIGAIIGIIFSILVITNISSAYTLTSDDIKVEEGQEFTVILKVDTETPLANGHIKFDSSKVEFISASQENMNAAVNEDGNLAWMYMQISADGLTEGVKQFEFTFKAKSSDSSELCLEDLAFVDIDGNEYTVEDIQNPKTTIYVNKKNNNIIIPIIIVIVIILAIIILINKSKKTRRK